MSFTEQAIIFPCAVENLLGIVAGARADDLEAIGCGCGVGAVAGIDRESCQRVVTGR